MSQSGGQVPRILATLLFLTACVPCFPDPVFGTGTTYWDQLAFERAIGTFARPVRLWTDDFASGRLSVPGVSVSSNVNLWGYDIGAGNGHFVQGAYSEYTGKYTETVWHFAQPVYAFGGTWNLGAVNAGLEIAAAGHVYFLPDGLISAHSWYSAENQWSGFWGFVSTVPVDTILIRAGDEAFFNSNGQTYQFSNMEIATVMPEPGSIALALIGAALIGAGRLRRLRRRASRES